MHNEIKEKYIYYFTFIGSTSAIIFGIYNLISPDTIKELGIVEVVAGILSLLNILLLYKYKMPEISASILLGLMYLILALLVVTGGISSTGIAWIFTFPVLAYGLKNSRQASLWIVGLFIIICFSWNTSKFFNNQMYQWTQIRQYSIVMFAVSALMFIYKRIQEKTDNLIQSQLADIQKYKQAVDNSSDIIVITDQSGKIIYANQSVKRITGFDPVAVIGEKAGRPWGGLMDKQTYKLLWKTIREDKLPFEGEMRNKRKDGREYDAHLHIDPILDEHKNVLFFVGIERDITKLKEDERLKEEFLSFASHQLRTPLSAVQWLNQILADGTAGPLTDQQKTIVSKMNLALSNMNSSIKDFLDVNRTETGKYKLHPKEINIVQVVDNIMVTYESLFSHKQITVIRDLKDAPQSFVHDEEALKNILSNLLSNAIKYSNENSSVELVISKKDGDLHITCTDTGIGIPSSDLDNIGKKFFRGSNASQKEVNGTGVGLYLLDKLVQLAGGSWKISSIENKGTTVGCILPQLKVD